MGNIQDSAAILFQGGHISKFVYVDDEFGRDAFSKEQCKVYVENHIDQVDFIKNPTIWADEFEAWWRDTSDKEHIDYGKRWGLSPENADHLKEIFSGIIPAGVASYYYSPQELEEKVGELLGDLDVSHQMMILVDYALEGYERDGEELLGNYADKDYVNCALFSGKFPKEEELERWNSSADKANIFAISKERIESEDEDLILEGLRNVLWLKQISNVKNYAKKLVGDATSYMSEQLDKIDPSTFHKIVMDKSANEGCWEFETMMRILHAFANLGLKTKMMEGGFDDFQTLIGNLRAIKNNAEAHSSNKTIVEAITEEEVYESKDYINHTFSQITNGDIFRIGQGDKEYILLCQPCSLVIRSDGNRTKKTFDQFFVIPIRKEKDGDEKHPYIEFLHPTSESEKMIAELHNYFRISLSVLDLVSFNPEGNAVIDISVTSDNHPYKHVLQDNMMKRYDIIQKRVSSYKSKHDVIKESEIEREFNEAIRKEFCHPYELGDPKKTKHPIVKGNEPNVIDFSITRMRRYKDPYAKDLLQLFMNYLSRPGYALDLLR